MPWRFPGISAQCTNHPLDNLFALLSAIKNGEVTLISLKRGNSTCFHSISSKLTTEDL
jgi:hypothetical protein